MTKEEIQARYKALILPENKNPYHFEKVESANTIEAYNPMCGDKYDLYLDEDSQSITTAHFHGIGCAISKASTSLLLRAIEGKPKDEVIRFCQGFMDSIDRGEVPENFSDGLKVLVELKNFEGRVDCIQLSWKALLEHLIKSA